MRGRASLSLRWNLNAPLPPPHPPPPPLPPPSPLPPPPSSCSFSFLYFPLYFSFTDILPSQVIFQFEFTLESPSICHLLLFLLLLLSSSPSPLSLQKGLLFIPFPSASLLVSSLSTFSPPHLHLCSSFSTLIPHPPPSSSREA